MSLRARALLFAALLTAVGPAFAGARDHSLVSKAEPAHDDAKCSEAAKSETKPADTAERPPASASESSCPSEPGPSVNVAPARDPVRPARPAKQRPAWPPPPELIA